MRRPPGSSPADITSSRRLPIKKRPYMLNQEDVGPSSNKVKIACASKKTQSSLCKLLVLVYHKTNKRTTNELVSKFHESVNGKGSTVVTNHSLYSRTSMARTPVGPCHEIMFETGVIRANEC